MLLSGRKRVEFQHLLGCFNFFACSCSWLPFFGFAKNLAIYISHMYKCWRNLSHDIKSKHKNQFSGNNEAKPKFEVGSEQWRKCYMKVFVIVLLWALKRNVLGRPLVSRSSQRCTCPNRMNITYMLLHLTWGHCVSR